MVDGGGERLPHDRHEWPDRPDVFGQVLMLDNRRLLEQDAYTHLVARVAQGAMSAVPYPTASCMPLMARCRDEHDWGAT